MLNSILLVEDNEKLCRTLAELLECQGYVCYVANDTESVTRYLDEKIHIDLYIIDITLPDGNGFFLCKKIRCRGLDTPIIFLTADGTEDSLVKGFDLGGSDYIVKPYRARELLARVDAQMRRINKAPRNTDIEYVSGDLVVNLKKRTVHKNGVEMKAGRIEFDILELLLISNSNVVSKDAILSSIWDDRDKDVEINTLNVHISRLRKNLGEYEGRKYIESKWGIGYSWAIPIFKREVRVD